MADWLFGSPLVPMTSNRWFGLGTIVILFVLGIVVTIMRLPRDARNLLWAEDGSVFLTDAFTHGYVTNLFTPYAGYMHFLPRTAAEISSLIAPIRDLGLAMNLFGAATWSMVALAALVFTRGRLRFPFRLLLWLLVLLLPVGSHEVATNTANSHWFLMFGLFMALTARSGSPLRLAFASLLVAASVLSDPLSLIFTPFVIARLFLLRGIRENVLSLVFTLSAAVQLLVVLGTSRDRGEPGGDPLDLIRIYLTRIVWGDLVGPRTGSWLFYTLGAGVALTAATVLLTALVATIAIRYERAGLAIAALGSSFVSFMVIAVLTWTAFSMEPLAMSVYWSGRYLVLPSLLLIVAVVATLSVWLPAGRPAGRRALRGAAFAACALLLIAPGIDNYRFPEYKAGNPQTSTGLTNAEHLCASGRLISAEVPVAPSGFYLGLPCSTVLDR